MAEVKSNFTTIEAYANDVAYVDAKKALEDANKSNIMDIIQAKIVLYNAMMTYLFGCAVIQRSLEWIQAVLVPVGFSPEELGKLSQFTGKVETATPAAATPRREPADTPRPEPAATPAATPDATPAATPDATPTFAREIPPEISTLRDIIPYLKLHDIQKNDSRITSVLTRYNLSYTTIIKYLKDNYMLNAVSKDEHNDFRKLLKDTWIDRTVLDYNFKMAIKPILLYWYNCIFNRAVSTKSQNDQFNSIYKGVMLNTTYGVRIAELSYRNSATTKYITNVDIINIDSPFKKIVFSDGSYIFNGSLFKNDNSTIENNNIQMVISLYLANMHIFNSEYFKDTLNTPLKLYEKIKNVISGVKLTNDNKDKIFGEVSTGIKYAISVRYFTANGEKVTLYGNALNIMINGNTTQSSCTLHMIYDQVSKVYLFPNISDKSDMLQHINNNGDSDYNSFDTICKDQIALRIKIYKALRTHS